MLVFTYKAFIISPRQVQDDLDEDEDDDLPESNAPGAMQMGGELDDDDMQNSNEGLTINVQDIDAY